MLTVFAPGVNLGNFSARYESELKPVKDETIAFSFQTQGYIRLYIDGKEVASGLNVKNSHAYEMNVEKGKTYDIKVDYVATEGNCATLNFDFGREVPLNLSSTVKLNFDFGREVPLNLSSTVNKVKDADVVIFAGGISPQLEGEEMPIRIPGFNGGDRESKLYLQVVFHLSLKARKCLSEYQDLTVETEKV